MIVGVDFPSFFDKDNFTLRRTTGNNMHDPESFITGRELEQGFTYTNSRRNWHSYRQYVAAVIGNLTPEQIAELAPRVTYPDWKQLHEKTFSAEPWLSMAVEEAGEVEAG